SPDLRGRLPRSGFREPGASRVPAKPIGRSVLACPVEGTQGGSSLSPVVRVLRDCLGSSWLPDRLGSSWLSVAALFLSACSGGGSSGPPAATRPPDAGPTRWDGTGP